MSNKSRLPAVETILPEQKPCVMGAKITTGVARPNDYSISLRGAQQITTEGERLHTLPNIRKALRGGQQIATFSATNLTKKPCVVGT